jgi:hypothetical protein
MQVKDETAKKRKHKTAAKSTQAAAAKPAAVRPATPIIHFLVNHISMGFSQN